ncbi:MAG: GHKL domain-containing protein [Roseburia sp.]|nr:GHKL domain-containing protein [Roseburia sp.]MCM1278888.1 GHKL domain-containing protein [Robinsoniella sp.]
MKDIFYFLMDLGECTIKGYLLYQMVSIAGRVQKNPAFVEKRKKYLLIFQYVLFHMLFSYIPWLKTLVYGGNMYLLNSKQTITTLLLSLFCSSLAGCCYGSHEKKLSFYLVFTYYAIGELVRFILYVPGNLIFQQTLRVLEGLGQNGDIAGMEQSLKYIFMLEIVWNVVFTTVYVLSQWLMCQRFMKSFSSHGEKIGVWEFLFLMLSSVIGFCFCLFLRSILFTFKEENYIYLLEENPELQVLTPFIALLGLISIFSSVYLWSRLKKEQEENHALFLYEERLSEMEEHVQEMERLYEGMRGMKHDMKNYVADIEGLMGSEEKLSKDTKEALKNYLDGLCTSLEELDMKYKTGNPVTDTVVNRYLRRAEKMGAIIKCDFIYPAHLEIDSFDLSILLNNGLENASEALEKCREKPLHLEIGSYVKGNMFFLEIRNSFSGTLAYDRESNTFHTTKKEKSYHGYGLKNMQKSVEKYFGKIEYRVEEQVFVMTAMLQGRGKEKGEKD